MLSRKANERGEADSMLDILQLNLLAARQAGPAAPIQSLEVVFANADCIRAYYTCDAIVDPVERENRMSEGTCRTGVAGWWMVVGALEGRGSAYPVPCSFAALKRMTLMKTSAEHGGAQAAAPAEAGEALACGWYICLARRVWRISAAAPSSAGAVAVMGFGSPTSTAADDSSQAQTAGAGTAPPTSSAEEGVTLASAPAAAG